MHNPDAWTETARGDPPVPPARTMLAALADYCTTPFLDLKPAVDAALDLIMQYVGTTSAFVAQFDTGQLQMLEAVDPYGCGIETHGVMHLDDTFCQYVRANHAVVVVDDAYRDPRTRMLASRTQFSIAAYIGVPLLLNDGTMYGTVCALDSVPRSFSAEQVDFMRLIAQHLAGIIEHQQLTNLVSRTVRDSDSDLSATIALLDTQTTLLGIVAHDIRTPLASIRGYADLIMMDVLGPINEEQRDAARRIGIAVHWINRMVNDLLDAAAMEAQTFALTLTVYQPEQVVQQVADLCLPMAIDRQIALSVACDAHLPTAVGDADRVQQVLLNFLNNALRYTQRGSVVLSARQVGAMIEFRLTDTGPGIAPADQERIWGRNQRAVADGKGLGLGLYVVQQLVTAMGGEVGVESTLGIGSTFWARIPIISPDAA